MAETSPPPTTPRKEPLSARQWVEMRQTTIDKRARAMQVRAITTSQRQLLISEDEAASYARFSAGSEDADDVPASTILAAAEMGSAVLKPPPGGRISIPLSFQPPEPRPSQNQTQPPPPPPPASFPPPPSSFPSPPEHHPLHADTPRRGSRTTHHHDPSPLTTFLQRLIAEHRPNHSGKLADYIPKLAEVDPSLCGVCVVTASGSVHMAGDCEHLFTIQSISKAFTYDLILSQWGKAHVMQHIDVEPSGEAFNSLKLEAEGRPPNPMVNIGAIQSASMVKGNADTIRAHYSRFAGRTLHVDEAVCQCETETGNKNRALAYLLKDVGKLHGEVDAALAKYFHQCSVLVNAKDLAMMAATLANGGVNPVTGETATSLSNATHVMSVMATCGMYNYAGNWMCDVGLPAKSGVGGGICCVVPGVLGIGVFSAPLDHVGNSVRGVALCHELSSMMQLSVYQPFGIAFASPVSQAVVVDSRSMCEGRVHVVTTHGNLSVIGVEHLAATIEREHSTTPVFVLEIGEGMIDTAGLVLLELLVSHMRETNRQFFLVVADPEDSLLSLRLRQKLGSDQIASSVDHVVELFDNPTVIVSGGANLSRQTALPHKELSMVVEEISGLRTSDSSC